MHATGPAAARRRAPASRAHRMRAGLAALALVSAAGCSQASALANGAGANWSGRVTVSPAALRIHGDPPAPADTAVLTQRGSSSRVGWNGNETVLDQANVNVAGFGRRVAYPVDGKIYAQPLFVPGLRADGQVHNVVIVATERDSVYAFDADASGQAPAPLWHTSFLVNGAVPVQSTADLECPSIAPTFGITGTPVIDRAAGTLYVVATMKVAGVIVDYLHALNISTGHDRMAPVLIRASVHGTGAGSKDGRIAFDAHQEQQHMGLLLDRGVVYAGFASYCDRDPMHGWILGYRTSDLRRVVTYNDTPNGYGGGIWESATGLAASASGDIIFITGNGTFDLASGGQDASDTVLDVRPQHGTLVPADYFTPFYQSCLNANDQDYGSGAPLLLPREVIAIGKEGAIAVLSRAHLGGYVPISRPCHVIGHTDIDHVVQEFRPQTVTGGVWSAETTWSGPAGQYVYIAPEAGHLSAWRIAAGRLAAPPASHAPEIMMYPGGIPVGSSHGPDPASAIVWIMDQEKGPALRAYAAGHLSDELYSTQQDASRDGIPGYDNFCLPTVADGRVFVGTKGELIIYGLLA